MPVSHRWGGWAAADCDVLARNILARHIRSPASAELGQVWAEAARDPEVASMASECILVLRRALTTLVARCQADGTMSPAGDMVLMGQALVGMLPGHVLQRLLDDKVTVESYVRGATDLLGSAVASAD